MRFESTEKLTQEQKIVYWVKRGVIGLVVLIVLFGSFGTVASNEIGVKTRLGKVVGAVSPGLYLKMPFLEHVSKMNFGTQTATYDGTNALAAASKDLQDVRVASVVNYHIDKGQAQNIFIAYQSTDNYQSNVVEPIIRDTVKAMSAQYTAEELVTKRAEFNDRASQLLTERLQQKSVVVEKLNITNLKFSDTFEAAIEAKATAVQSAETAKNKLEQTKYEAEQRIAQAQGEAEAIKIQSQAINSQGGKSYTDLKAIEKWDGHLPQQFYPWSDITIP
jgi:regulator of protease activity HflC (stomatin/prohibitin superfamily)